MKNDFSEEKGSSDEFSIDSVGMSEAAVFLFRDKTRY